MKTSSHVFRTANLLSLGTLLVFAGCTSVPMRQSTLALETESTPNALDMNRPGYEAPAVLHSVSPEHPWQLRRLGIPGTVTVNLIVDETGQVTDARVANSSDNEFNAPSLAALKQWTFTPASQDGVPYPSRVSVPIRFEFDD